MNVDKSLSKNKNTQKKYNLHGGMIYYMIVVVGVPNKLATECVKSPEKDVVVILYFNIIDLLDDV